MHTSDNFFIAAVDFWSPSVNALEMAARFATQFKGRVLAIHVIEKLHSYPEHLSIDTDTIEEDLEKAMEELLKPLLDRGILVEYEFRNGDVTRQLSQAVHDHDTDALFLGTREGKFLEDIFIGSHTKHLLKTSMIPIVVVESAPRDSEIREVLIPFYPTIGINGVFKFLKGLNMPIAETALLITAFGPNDNEQTVDAATDVAADQLAGLGISQIEMEIAQDDDPYEAIINRIRDNVGNFDLVLLEQPDFALMGDLSLAGIVEDVVTKCRMPVVCVPSAYNK